MKLVLAENGRIVEIGRGTKFLAIAATGLLLAAGLFVPRASASIYTLGVGGNNNNPASGGFPTGAYNVLLIHTNLFSASSIQGTISGTVFSEVISGDASNPYHGLTFEYFVTEASGNTDIINAMSASGFAGFQTDVSYNSAVGGVAPSSFSRSGAINNGNTLSFDWASPNINPGQNGDEIVVQTSASNYQLGLGNIQDSEGTQITILTPAVPEPEIASLAAMGLGALFIFRRRNSK